MSRINVGSLMSRFTDFRFPTLNLMWYKTLDFDYLIEQLHYLFEITKWFYST